MRSTASKAQAQGKGSLSSSGIGRPSAHGSKSRRSCSIVCKQGGGGGVKIRQYKASDGKEHLGSALDFRASRPFPGPPSDEGPPLRVLPIGGLGEIGMNCMLVGVKDRYILIDAGLMFPDFQDYGMQKILPDTSFLAQWRDKIEAVLITHGHEDHIGALPWVLPALDPATPVYAGSFVMKLVERRAAEFSLFDPARFRVMDMRRRFQAGPFEVEPIRVTHSIPDCCGLVLRSEHGTIVHTGDWKIDEDPVDGEIFDRETFDMLGKEPVALMMSDSTNVLSPGRTLGENTVRDSLVQKVLAHQGKGRVIATQFASNLHRMHSVKAAADASGRKICFIGMSLNTYLDAAWRDGRAPFDPRDLINAKELDQYDPNQVLVVTTGSQAEPRAQLSLAAREASQTLRINRSDLVLYSAKMIPGNETRVVKMLNALSELGADVRQGRADNLHVSGHAYQEELTEVLRYVKPQHFLPVHGEYSFLVEHARLAKEKAGVNYTEVIKNGQMLGIHERRSRNHVSSSSMAVIGEAALINYFNDGGRGTGTAQEMAIEERGTIATEGIIVVAVDVTRPQAAPGTYGATLDCRVRLTSRAMWTDRGGLLDALHDCVEVAVRRMPWDVSLTQVERTVVDAVRRRVRTYSQRKPEVIAIAYEHDPRAAHLPEVAAKRRQQQQGQQYGQQQEGGQQGQQQAGAAAGRGPRIPRRKTEGAAAPYSGSSSSQGGAPKRRAGGKAPPPLQPLPPGVMEKRRAANPRDAPNKENNTDYG